MRKIKIISTAAVVALACAAITPTASSFATGNTEEQNLAPTSTSVYQSLQSLLDQVYLIPDYAANPELVALVDQAEAFDENSDPAEIESVFMQLNNLVASAPTSTSYDGSSDGSGSSSGGDPADDFEDKHEPTNPGTSSSSSETSTNPQDTSQSNPPSNRRSASGSVPNTGVADQASATSAVASSAIFIVAGLLATVGFCAYRYRVAKK